MVSEPLCLALQNNRVTVHICSKLNQAENRLFLEINLGRILDILRAFLIKQSYSTRAGWI